MIHFIICLLITIAVHEMAHMLVALYCGIGVKAFSLGFGKPYLHKTIKGIDFRLSPLLLGGYCDIQGFDSKEDHKDFLAHPYRHKFAVLVAGVTANILLAFIIYLYQFGSIKMGIAVDWVFLKAMFTQDYSMVEFVIRNISFNFFLVQLSLLNFFCGLTNLIPIPALDGGHLWLVLMEKSWKNKFIKRYELITNIYFICLILLQFYLIYWIYFGR